jgi:hypothetical protein
MVDQNFIERRDVTLESTGASALFDKHLPAIVDALYDVEEGKRAYSKAVLTLKVEVGWANGNIAVGCSAGLKLPPFVQKGLIGDLREGKMTYIHENAEQAELPGVTPINRNTTEDGEVL